MLTRTGDSFGLAPLGEALRDDDPAGRRAWLHLEGAIGRADLCFVELLHTVRTGEPAFPRRFGRPYWEDLSADPGLAASFDAAGLGDRADACAGSFFDPLPADAGGYLLSGVLHDWDDEPARRILQRCADAAGETGRVLVVDHVGGSPDTEGDLRMRAYVSGRERDLDQLTELAASAGLHLGSCTRTIVELSRRPG